MSIKCSEIVKAIEEYAPVQLAEGWDNVGLILGSLKKEIRKVMVCLDVTSKVADDAIKEKVDLIISHHPMIFEGIKSINSDDAKGRLLYRLIQNDISVYSAHTNLDVASGGVNDCLAGELGLMNIKHLNEYKEEKAYKIAVFVPEDSIDHVRNAMCNAGAGWIGNYSDCTFMTKGTGTFRPLEGTNPHIGTQDVLEHVSEYRLETIVSKDKLKNVLEAMHRVHPYEEVAYDLYRLEINGAEYGLGKVGHLEKPQSFKSFIEWVKKRLGIPHVRVIGELSRDVRKVAVFCGSFDGNWTGFLKSGADVLITGDIKYHTAQDALEMGLCVIDAGHFNTEVLIRKKLTEFIKDKFPDIDVICNNVESDPFKIT